MNLKKINFIIGIIILFISLEISPFLELPLDKLIPLNCHLCHR
jgi:hypothetical protein